MSDQQIKKTSSRSAAKRSGTTRRSSATKARGTRTASKERPKDLPRPITDANRRLKSAADVLAGAVADLHESESQAWREYSANVADSISRMNAELAVSMAQLKAAQAEGGPGLADALREADEARRAVVDNVRVQARLAAMEIEDRTKQATDGLEIIGERMEQMTTLVRDASTTALKGLVSEATDLFALLRHSIRAPMR